MVSIKSLYFLTGSERLEPGAEYSMTRYLYSDSRISAHFDNMYISLSKHAYFEVHFHNILSKYENSKHTFYDVITNELCYCFLFCSKRKESEPGQQQES